MKLRYIAVIAVLLICTISAFGCNNSGDGTNTATSSDTDTTALVPTVTLFRDGTTDHIIIRPARPSDEEFNAFIALQTAFKASGVIIDGERDSAEPSQYEIIIGQTDREESKQAAKGLRDDDYVIKVVGDKLIIVGGSPKATFTATQRFIEEYVSGKSMLEIPVNMSITETGQYNVGNLTINGIDISEFSIVTHYPATRRDTYASQMLSSAVNQLTGYTLKTYDDRKDATEHEIIIGATSHSDKTCGDHEYAVYFKDGNLHINGDSASLIHAVSSFISENLPDNATGDLALDITEDSTLKSTAVIYPAEATLDGKQLVALCDQKNSSLVIIDLNAPDPTSKDAIVWTWRPTAALGYTQTSSYGNRIDEAILRYSEVKGCYVVCITSSSGYMCVAEYPSGKCLWEASAAGLGPHSIEYLPDGNVAVVCSGNSNYQNGCVRIYTASIHKSSAKYVTKQIPGAHGVIWDDDLQLLWVLGDNKLCAFRISGTPQSPALTEVEQFCVHSGITGGHNLSVDPSDPDKLWITGSNVWTVRKSNGIITQEVPGGSVITRQAVKSMDSFEDGTIIQSVATNVTAAHNTDTLRVYRTSDGGKTYTCQTYVFADRAFYKARRVSAQYT